MANPRPSMVVIGAGPVGLITALMFEDVYNVTVLEKRTEYTRQQIVVLNKPSLDMLPVPVRDALFGRTLDDAHAPGCYILPPDVDDLARCYRMPASKDSAPMMASIRLDMLETALLAHVRMPGHNIDVVRGVTPSFSQDFAGLLVVHAGGRKYVPDVLVGADGGGSRVRSDVLRTQLTRIPSAPRQHDYGGIFIFTPFSKDDVMRSYGRMSGNEKVAMARTPQAERRVFRTRTGSSTYIGLKLTQKEHKAIMQDPKALPPRSVRERLDPACRVLSAEHAPCDYATLTYHTSIDIVARRAGRFSLHLGTQIAFLLGDSAITPHFFTYSGLNTGLAGVAALRELFENEGNYDLFQVSDAAFAKRMNALANLMGEKTTVLLKRPAVFQPEVRASCRSKRTLRSSRRKASQRTLRSSRRKPSQRTLRSSRRKPSARKLRCSRR